MFLKEFEGEALFVKYAIPTARGVVIDGQEGFREKLQTFIDEEPNIQNFVIKAQLLSGKRGKGGGVLFAGKDVVFDTVEDFFGKRVNNEDVNEIFVQEKLDIGSELYFGITIDRFLRRNVLIFSEEGGMEIEDIAAETPDKIIKIPFGKDGSFDGEKLPKNLREALTEFAKKLHELVINEDAVLAEINPLILTKEGELYAADAKVIIDNNAVFKYPELLDKIGRGASELEEEAHKNGLAYVELDGDIAVIGNGAGLVMATLDSVDEYGGNPANFCDLGGGATREMIERAISIVLQKIGIRVLFINVFGGITHCDEVALGIVGFLKGQDVKVPIVVRMVGTNAKEAYSILHDAGITALESFEEAAKQAASY